MIRPTLPGDTPALLEIARGTEVFKPIELVALNEVLDDYHAREHGLGHRCVTAEREGLPAGFAYYAPASMADRTWYLYWIAVAKASQSLGLGASMLRAAESDIRRRDGRLLLVETSSLPHYEPTRRFYLRMGYDQAAVLGDFYAEGDHMVVFRKRRDALAP